MKKQIALICRGCNHVFFDKIRVTGENQEITCTKCKVTKTYMPHEVKKGIKDWKDIWEGSRYANNHL